MAERLDLKEFVQGLTDEQVEYLFEHERKRRLLTGRLPAPTPETLPWKYDLENMPKDGTDFLAWCGRALVVKCGAPWKLPGFVMSDVPQQVDGIVAWLPITPPSKEVVS